jgi:hypothetical protein
MITSDSLATTPAMESFVGKFRLLDGQGVEGLNKQAALWTEYEGSLSDDQFARCTVVLGLSSFRPSGVMMETLARRFARAQAILSQDFSHWAMLTVLTIFDDQIFESFLQRALGMTPMFANEILEAIMAAPLNYRVEGGTVYANKASRRGSKGNDIA